MPFSVLFSARQSGFSVSKLLLLTTLSVVVLFTTGCHARSSAPAISAVPARSLTTLSSALSLVRSSPLYQQARQDCTRHDYRKAADRLQTLARTPSLTPDAVAFCNTQRDMPPMRRVRQRFVLAVNRRAWWNSPARDCPRCR